MRHQPLAKYIGAYGQVLRLRQTQQGPKRSCLLALLLFILFVIKTFSRKSRNRILGVLTIVFVIAALVVGIGILQVEVFQTVVIIVVLLYFLFNIVFVTDGMTVISADILEHHDPDRIQATVNKQKQTLT